MTPLLQAVRAREGAAAAQKAAQEEEKDRIFQKISKDILRRQAEEEEMLELQIELANQEAEERRVLVACPASYYPYLMTLTGGQGCS